MVPSDTVWMALRSLRRTSRPAAVGASIAALTMGLLGCADPTANTTGLRGEILYRGNVGNVAGVVAMRPDGSGRRVLITPRDGQLCGSLSRDGRFLAVMTGGSALLQSFGLSTIDLVTNAERFFTHATLWYGCPAWSPDGTRLAYTRGPATAPNGWGLYTMNADGTDVRTLLSAGIGGGIVAWSPDGRWIAAQTSTGPSTLVRIDAATGAVTTTIAAGAVSPAWSPDGRSIAFSIQTGVDVDIFVADTDGSKRRQLTSRPPGLVGGWVNYTGQWSPDGTHLVFWRQSGTDIQAHLVIITGSGVEVPFTATSRISGDAPFWR